MMIDADSNPTVYILWALTESGMEQNDAFNVMMRFHRLSKQDIVRAVQFPQERPITPHNIT